MKPGWWAVYYEDGSKFSSEDGEPFAAPAQGVMVVAQEKNGDYQLAHGMDYFYWEPERGGWATCDQFGAFDHLCRAKRQCLKFGRMLSDEEWAKLFQKIKTDLGPRGGRHARETSREPRL